MGTAATALTDDVATLLVWTGSLAVGLINVVNVVTGGMRAITLVQALHYWLKLTGIRRTRGLLGVFSLFPAVLGVLARLYVPQLLVSGTTDAAVLMLPGAVLGGLGGQLLAALVAAGAIAGSVRCWCSVSGGAV